MSKSVKPISYFKSHAAEMIRTLEDTQGTYIITQNGEAKAVLQDIKTYEEIEEAITLLKILALSEEDVRKGRVKPLKTAFADIREKIKTYNKNNKNEDI